MLGCGEMLVEPTVKLGTVVFANDDDLAAEMHCRSKNEWYHSALNMHYGQIEGAEHAGALKKC